jgi:hypothetical protein
VIEWLRIWAELRKVHSLNSLTTDFFTLYVLKLTPHVSETQSLSIFSLASFKTNNSGNYIYAEAFIFGRRKAEEWDRYPPPELYSALLFNTHDSNSIKSINSEVIHDRKNLMCNKSKLVAFHNAKISREDLSLWKSYFL